MAERIRDRVTLFQLFEPESSAYGVVQRFHHLGLLFPRRSYGGAWNGKLAWGRLTHSPVIGVLTNPSYAGTNVFGRHHSCKKIGPTGEICTQSRQLPQDQWRIVIPDHHPGYITWDQFLANRRRLAANRTNNEILAGPAREGHCLLQGLLLCGICGRRLTVRYAGNAGIYPIYCCTSRKRDALSAHRCFSMPARPLDDAIVQRLLVAVTPVTVRLALEPGPACPASCSESAELEEAGLFRMQTECELCQAFLEIDLEALRILPVLDCIIGIPHDHIALCVARAPLLDPEIINVMKVHIRKPWGGCH